MKLIPKPNAGEYAPYTIMYIDLLPDDERILLHLQSNLESTITLIRSLPEEKLIIRHAPSTLLNKQSFLFEFGIQFINN